MLKKKLFLLSVALLALFCLLAILRHRTELRNWKELGARADQLQAQLEGIERNRPVLWGEARIGVAWDSYAEALEIVKGHLSAARRSGSDGMVNIHELQTVEADTKPEAIELRARMQPALVHLNRGAHSTLGGVPLDWDQGTSAKMPTLMQSRYLVLLALSMARAHLEAERDSEAVHLWLDALQFGRDLTRNQIRIPQCIGYGLWSTVAEPLIRDIPAMGLSSADLTSLRDGLTILLAEPPPASLGIQAESLILLRDVLSANTGERDEHLEHLLQSSDGGYGLWRYGFSLSTAFLDVMDRAEAMDVRAGQLTSGAGAMDSSALICLDVEAQASVNPITRVWWPLQASVHASKVLATENLNNLLAVVELELIEAAGQER